MKNMKKTFGVCAAHPLAVEAGMDILQRGGNAVDAAVTVSFVLGVVEPYASGIGGGGNMLVFPVDERQPVVFDYRETAPRFIHPAYQIGVPGFVKGMAKAHQSFGHLSWQEVLAPAIELAYDGFAIGSILANNLVTANHLDRSANEPYFPNLQPLQSGEKLVQKKLGFLMEQMATKGVKYFYEGQFSEKLIQAKVGITDEDLATYSVKKRQPLCGSYRQQKLYTAPAPVAGSLLIQTLRLVEQTNLDQYLTKDLSFQLGLSDILQLCYHEFYHHIGDPDFVALDEIDFLDQSLRRLLKSIESGVPLNKKRAIKDESHTTHFSVIDADGMAVATTNTLSNFFGSGVFVEGIYLNNQMQNYATTSRMPNSVAHGKRCVSTIAPTILTEKDKPYLIIGASGAARIPFSLAKIIVDIIKQGKSVDDAIQASRFFAQDDLFYSEKPLTPKDQYVIKDQGYKYIYHPNSMFYGGVQAILVQDGKLTGAADWRRGGSFQQNYIQKYL